MADTKPKTKIVYKGATPPGLFTWLWVEKPDNSEYGKGKFKAALRLKKGEAGNDAYARKIIDLHKAAKGKAGTCPVKDGDKMAEENDKREAMRGFWVVSAKSKNKPEQVDVKNTPLKATAKSGDFGRLAIAASEFDTGANKGVTLYLNALRLLERRATSAVDDFGDEDGDYAPDTAAAPTEDGTDSSTESETPEDDEDF
jgi:hypothetical protein